MGFKSESLFLLRIFFLSVAKIYKFLVYSWSFLLPLWNCFENEKLGSISSLLLLFIFFIFVLGNCWLWGLESPSKGGFYFLIGVMYLWLKLLLPQDCLWAKAYLWNESYYILLSSCRCDLGKRDLFTFKDPLLLIEPLFGYLSKRRLFNDLEILTLLWCIRGRLKST